MRKVLLLATLCMVAAMVFATAALAQTRGPSGTDGTYNCEDFDDQGQAQEFYNGDPGDSNGLDSDDDGIACEELPTIVDDGTPDGSAIPGAGESASASSSATASPSAEICDGGPTRVTPDGIQCSNLPDVIPGATTSATAEADDDGSASATATASASALPETGGAVSPVMLSVLAGMMLVGGGIASAAIARRG